MSEQGTPSPQEQREPLSKTVIAAIVAVSGLVVAITGLVAVLTSSSNSTGDTSAEGESVAVTSEVATTVAAASPSDTTVVSASADVAITTTTESDDVTTTGASLGAASDTGPLNWFVEADPSFFSESAATSFGYVMPGTRGQIGKAPSEDCRSWYAWTSELDMPRAVSGGPMFQVILSSAVDETIVINGFSVEIRRKESPMDGTEVICFGLPLTDPLRVHTLNVDLDQEPPIVTLERPESDVTESDDIAFQLSEKGETLLLEVWAVTTDCDCDWVLILSYVNVANGERGRLEITEDGEPWRSSSGRNADSYAWSPVEQDWAPAP